MPPKKSTRWLLAVIVACAPCVAAQTTTVVPADCPGTMIAMAGDVPALRPEAAPVAREFDRDEQQACSLALEAFESERAQVTIVDVRDAAERSRAAIPGALAVAVAEIGKKSFLRDARVVLVGSGLDDSQLFAQCAALRREGSARVAVLVGGVRALARAGATLAGQSDEIQKLDGVSVQELHRLALRSPASIVLAGIDPAAAMPATLERAQRIALDGNATASAEKLKKMSDAHKGALLAAVTPTKESAEALHTALQAAHAARVYVLREGFAGYLAYLDEQRRIAANANIRLVHPCGSS
jgi:rhodanese-related sulfurtransferase